MHSCATIMALTIWPVFLVCVNTLDKYIKIPNHFNSWLLQSKMYLCHVFYCLSEFQNWTYISLLLTLFPVTRVCCKGNTVCWWTLEGSEECVRCLITTNTEAFRCVSDSFATHMDPLSLSEEACPLKERENTAALSCNLLRNAGMWGISSKPVQLE